MTDPAWRIVRPPYKPILGYRWDIRNPSVHVAESTIASYTKEQLLSGATGHYGYPRFNRPDVGGEFLKRYRSVDYNSCGVGTIQGGGPYQEYRYTGSVLTTDTLLADPIFLSVGDQGAAAYAKMKPDQPIMQGLNAIFEMREIPGMLRQRFLQNGLNSIGDYYLALKFGWEPLLRDIRDFVGNQRKAQDALKQLIRDEGKPIHRHIQLADSREIQSTQSGAGSFMNVPSFVSYFYENNGATWTREVSANRKVWASARFRYWLPTGPRDVNWTRAMIAAIYGFRPSPKVVWNALPWTWLIDWYSSVGDAISNLSTTLVDRCSADYFYMMSHAFTEVKFTTRQGYVKAGGGVTWATCSCNQRSGTKAREHGNPFGFGDPGRNLSGVQMSILGALGLSRL